MGAIAGGFACLLFWLWISVLPLYLLWGKHTPDTLVFSIVWCLGWNGSLYFAFRTPQR